MSGVKGIRETLAGYASGALPPDLILAPVDAEPGDAALQLCVALRDGDDGVEPIVLRELIDGRALLGCVRHAHAATVHEWVELWVQAPLAGDGPPSAATARPGNAELDRRWRQRAEAWAALDPAGTIPLREGRPQQPQHVDVAAGRLWSPTDPAGRPFVLCRDERLLADAGLPSYAATPHRYLVNAGAPDAERQWVALSADAPTPPEDAAIAADALAGGRDLVPINPDAGLVLVRRHRPAALDAFADYLGGAPAEEAFAALEVVSPEPPAIALADAARPDAGDWLFSAGPSRATRLLESVALKVALLVDAMRAVREQARRDDAPLLNVTADSFRVQLGHPGPFLPLLWTARVVLVVPGEAVEVPVPNVDARYFLPMRELASPYRAVAAARRAEGVGTLRLRRVAPEGDGSASIEATLGVQDRVPVAATDLLWLRAGVGRTRVDLWGRIETEASSASEWRFRTVVQSLGDADLQRLQALEGQVLGDVPYEVLGAQNTPCDLYSLGVLGMRLLLVNARRSLPIVIDELLSLAGALNDAADRRPLAERLEAAFKNDARLRERFGPIHALFDPAPDAAPATDALPIGLWSQVVALLIRMLPGVDRDAFRRSYGDAPAGAPHRAFDAAIAEAEAVAMRLRGLLTLDWRANREINAIVRSVIAQPVGDAAAFAGGRSQPASTIDRPATTAADAPAKPKASAVTIASAFGKQD